MSLMHAMDALTNGALTTGGWTLSVPSFAAGMGMGVEAYADVPPPPPPPTPPSAVDAALVAKCTRLLGMGVPAGAILAKLRAEGIDSASAARALAATGSGGGGGGAYLAAAPPGPAAGTATLLTLGLEPGLAARLELLFAPRTRAPPLTPTALTITVNAGPVAILDARRAMQVGIGLVRFRGVPRSALRAALEALSPLSLTPAQCVMLETITPTPAEAAAVTSAFATLGERRLGDAEAFFLELSPVPRARERAAALAFRVGASARLRSLAERAASLRAAADALAADGTLQRIATVASALAMRSGCVPALSPFSLLSLVALKGARLPHVHFRDARGTLLHLLAAVLERTDAQAAGWGVPPAVTAAAGADLTGLAAELDVGVREGAVRFRELLKSEGESVNGDPTTAIGDSEDDACDLAVTFAEKHTAATARLSTALGAAGEAWIHAWRAYSLPPVAPAPPPEIVFASLASFAAALQRCRVDMAQAEKEAAVGEGATGAHASPELENLPTHRLLK